MSSADPHEPPHPRPSTQSATRRRAHQAVTTLLRDTGGRLDHALVSAGADPVLARMRVADFLAAASGSSPADVRTVMTGAAIAPTRRVGALTAPQRAALLQYLAPPDTA